MVTHANIASPVFWDMVAILTYTVASFVFFLLPLVPDTATLLAARGDPGSPGPSSTIISGGWAGTPGQRRVLQAPSSSSPS